MTRFCTIFLFIISLTLITSCESDDGSNGDLRVNSGKFSIDNMEFSLSQGFFSPTFEDEPGLFYKTIIISDDGYSLVTSGNSRSLVGAANAVIIEIYSNANDNNLIGNYSITDGNATAGQATAYYAINYDIVNDTIDDEEEIASGDLSISFNNDGTYNLVLSNGQVDITGQPFSVNYDGTIKIVN